jgi:hypothetical protein
VLAFPNNNKGASTFSDVGGRPGWVLVCLDLRVSEAGIGELTIVVLLEEAGLNSVGNSKEVGVQLAVGQVHVEVVLEVFKHVHVLLNESVSSNSREREGLVEELPGVDVHLGGLTGSGHFLSNVVGISPMSGIEGSGEHVGLVVKLSLGLIEISAWGSKLDEGILNTFSLGFNKAVIELDGIGSQ